MSRNKSAGLRFADFATAEAYVQKLRGAKVETTGQWSAFRIYTHLADAVECTLIGFPKKPMPLWIRRTIGPAAFHGMMLLGYFPPKVPNVALPHKAREADAGPALDRLIGLLESFRGHEGPCAEHPFFGALSKSQWTTLHAWHLANHLSYVKVRSPHDS